jgi:transcriptional regulator with XRE-family HTH domain
MWNGPFPPPSSSATIVCGHLSCQWLAFPFVLGQEIRKSRLKVGMTQEDLAAKAAVTREYVSLLELNKRTPTVTVFVRLCRAMGISAPGLLGQIEDSLVGAAGKDSRRK